MSEVDEKTVSFNEMMESLKSDKDKEREKEKEPTKWLYVVGPGEGPCNGFTALWGRVIGQSPKKDPDQFAKARVLARMSSLGCTAFAAELSIKEGKIEKFVYKDGKETDHTTGDIEVLSGNHGEYE